MGPQQKGKVGTKGGKQIVEENEKTLYFYRNMIFGSSAIYLLLKNIIGSSFQFWDIVAFLFAASIFTGSIQFMRFMARAQYAPGTNTLLDSGLDLNIENGVSEQVKDVIILTCICVVLSLFSNYFWLLWLLVPLKGLFYAWTKVIGPWFFAPGPEAGNEEKKVKKIERKMRR